MKEVISAQVILKWSEFPPDDQKTLITAASIKKYKMDTSVTKKVIDFFLDQKFEVGKIIANSFSITAPIQHFQKFFGARIKSVDQLGLFVASGDSRLLPLKNLPGDVKNYIEQITFVEPPQLF